MSPDTRLNVRDTYITRFGMDHPPRGRRWTVRELADTLGVATGVINHIRNGDRSVRADIAGQFARAVGIHRAVLFARAL